MDWQELTYMYWKVENSIMCITYKKDVKIDVETAKQIVKQRLSAFAGKNYPVLLDGRGVKLISKEARDYLAKGDGMKGVTALALLPGNHLTVIMANLFVTFSRPTVPTKIFITKEAALKWLRQFIFPKR